MNKKLSFLLAHIALFIVFFWFGSLKLFGVSPAHDLVLALFVKIPFLNQMQFEFFMVLLGLVEMLIGVLFLFPRTTKYAIAILIPHMFTTILPLFFVTDMTWQFPFVPTLAGQYIIKNIVVVALAISVVMEKKRK